MTEEAERSVQGPDWFLPAIESEGSLNQCLDGVLSGLTLRTRFVETLKAHLGGRRGDPTDQITALSRRLQTLENTLQFRLGILRSERPAAWFRAPAVSTPGPFATSVIPEPVFVPYAVADIPTVKKALASCWERKTEEGLPFSNDGECLWRRVIVLNADLRRIAQLPAPFDGLSLATLPEGLPVELESPTLHAFLQRVSAEIATVQSRLDGCYEQILGASERLWAYQQEQQRRDQERGGARRGYSHAAETVRSEFRRRRSSRHRPLMSAKDREALRTLGFDHYPSAPDLKRRYHSLAKELHPDRCQGEDTGFKRLNQAYAHLAKRLERVSRQSS